MRVASRSLFASVALVAFLGLVIGAASQTREKVVVRVNNKSITEADVRLAEIEIMTQLVQIPADRRRQAILDYLIDGQLLADAAVRAKLDKQAQFEARRQYFQRRALRDAYFEEKIRDAITPDEVRLSYDSQASAVRPPAEYRARQILVGSELDARSIRVKLMSGTDFAALAKQISHDVGTGQNGGDLGYVVQGQLDPDFEKAVARLQVGELSAPIKTRFGWHIVRLEDRRTRPVPTWEEAKELVRLELLAQRTRDVVGEMRNAASIVYTDLDDGTRR